MNISFVNDREKMDGDGGGEGETVSEEENKEELIQETQQEPPVMEEYEPDEKSPLTQETQVSSSMTQ